MKREVSEKKLEDMGLFRLSPNRFMFPARDIEVTILPESSIETILKIIYDKGEKDGYRKGKETLKADLKKLLDL